MHNHMHTTCVQYLECWLARPNETAGEVPEPDTASSFGSTCYFPGTLETGGNQAKKRPRAPEPLKSQSKVRGNLTDLSDAQQLMGGAWRQKTGRPRISEHYGSKMKLTILFEYASVLFSGERIRSFCWILGRVSAQKRLKSKKEKKRLKSPGREYLILVSQAGVTLINAELKIGRYPPSLQGICGLSQPQIMRGIGHIQVSFRAENLGNQISHALSPTLGLLLLHDKVTATGRATEH